jgi:glycosyltransferase involved in cell wall biosynthesis
MITMTEGGSPPVLTVPKLSIVIPAYNERKTIEEILVRVHELPVDKEIIVVDDGSRDGTRELLSGLASARHQGIRLFPLPLTGKALPTECVHVVLHERNRGKGAAVRRGFQEATGRYVVVQDADLELDPTDLLRLLPPLERGDADAVYGSRYLGAGQQQGRLEHRVANRVLTTLSNLLTGYRLTDVWTCYKMFRREILTTIDLKEDRFGFEPEVTAKLARGRWRVTEVPINYVARSAAEGKKISWKDGLRGIWCTVRYGVCR